MNLIRKKGFLSLAKESFSQGLIIGIVIAVLGIATAFLAQDRFKASADFMVSSARDGQDYYTATRSAEYMSRVLGEILYSESFIAAMVNTGRVDADFLPRDKKDRLETWSETLRVKKNSELGFIRVSLAGGSNRDVAKTSQAIIEALDRDGGELFGNGSDKVNVRLLSGPIIERNPSASMLALIALSGLVFGFFSNFAWRLAKEEFRSGMNG